MRRMWKRAIELAHARRFVIRWRTGAHAPGSILMFPEGVNMNDVIYWTHRIKP